MHSRPIANPNIFNRLVRLLIFIASEQGSYEADDSTSSLTSSTTGTKSTRGTYNTDVD